MDEPEENLTVLHDFQSSRQPDWIPSSVAEWRKWLAAQEALTLKVYSEDPDRLIADYRREQQITKDYQGREYLNFYRMLTMQLQS